jgi:hypothetical protein
MFPVTYGAFTVYRSGARPAPEAMVYAHGGFHRRKGAKTTVPQNLSVYFYVPHGITSTDGALHPVVENTPAQSLASPVVRTFANGATFLNWAPGSVTSIAGPGTIVYDYELSWNDKYQWIVKEMRAAVRKQANYPKDLILMAEAKKDVNSKLSALFTAMAKFGPHYKILHFLPCRNPIGENDFDPRAINPEDAPKKLVR